MGRMGPSNNPAWWKCHSEAARARDGVLKRTDHVRKYMLTVHFLSSFCSDDHFGPVGSGLLRLGDRDAQARVVHVVVVRALSGCCLSQGVCPERHASDL